MKMVWPHYIVKEELPPLKAGENSRVNEKKRLLRIFVGERVI